MTPGRTQPRWRNEPADWLYGAAERADRIVHEHPLSTAGALFALGLALGCAAGLLLLPQVAEPPRWPRRQRAAVLASRWRR